MIRRLKEEDILKIVELENSTLNTSLGYDMLKSSLENEMAYFFVLEEEENILGYISTMFDGQIVEILNFCVDKNSQHKGLGTKILSFLDNYFYTLKAKSMILEVRNNNINAIKIYEKFGFKKIHVRKNYYSNGDDALILEHKLISPEELYFSYVEVNSKKEINKDYIKYFDDLQPDKYYANFYKVLNPSKELISELKNKKFREVFSFMSNKELDDLLDFKYEKDSLFYMHSSIFNLKPLKDNDFDIRLLDNSYLDKIYDYDYNASLIFGEEFAKGDAKRLSENIKNKELNYFGAFKDNELVGQILTYVKGDSLLVEGVDVKEEFKHKGYCSALFKYILNYYKNDIKEVMLIADRNDTVWQMYLDMGFDIIDSTYFYWMV